jgi:hypothetical protein
MHHAVMRKFFEPEIFATTLQKENTFQSEELK